MCDSFSSGFKPEFLPIKKDSWFTVHYGIHPWGTCRNISQSVHTLQISQGINPNIRQVFWKLCFHEVRMSTLLRKVTQDWK